MLDDSGWFYSTVPDVEASTALSEYQQKRCIKNLVDAGLIESKNRGLPAKRCFRIIEDIELISTLISQGEKNQLSIKPAAGQSYEKKRKNRIDAQQPCSAETTEQEKNTTINDFGACSEETAEQPGEELTILLPKNCGASSEKSVLPSLYKSKDNKSKENTDKSFKIGMVADIGGINDESFNQSAWEGLQKAEKDFGIEVKVIESKQASEYLQNMESLLDEDVDMVIGVGYTMKEDIEKQAKNYPDKQFVLIDETYDSIPENVTPILFRENEAAYLTGLVAGKMTENNNVGFIGGIQTPVISRFEYGYKAGVKEANKDCNVNLQNAATF